ncbi:hypothetical protein ACYYHG_000093 [Morganella morganii]
MDIPSVVKNMDFGLVVAVISLIFTIIVGGATIWYTRRSVRIAEQSLEAAKNSIYTSIEIYEKQKKDDAFNEKIKLQNRSMSLHYLIRNEVSANYIRLHKVVNFCKRVWSNDVINFEYNDLAHFPFANYTFSDGESDGFMFEEQSYSIIDKYLLDVADVDAQLISKLIGLRYSIEHFNNSFISGLKLIVKNNCAIEDLYEYVNDSKKFITSFEKLTLDTMDYCTTHNIKNKK